MMLRPSLTAMLPIDQFVVPTATPLPPLLLFQVTLVTSVSSLAVPDTSSALSDVVYCALAVGVRIFSVGGAESARVTVSTSVAMLPAASRAVTVRMLLPPTSGIGPADHEVVPVAVPLPPRLFVHVTWVTAASSL